ncbi:hypothetical protein ACLVWU_03350 [Bdellovibrio sp. HCB290]|uniref:hypothetical protein n=1 Tax=Bdellovibrio sp. HCB290 TaxID=3394356 RepID=UPI0039B49E20
MKRLTKLTIISILAVSAVTQAKTTTLLFCKDISQPDLKSLTIQENSNIQQPGLLELIEEHKDGSTKELYAMENDYEEGWIPMSPNEGTSRVLIRKEGKWTVAQNKGDYRVFNEATCVK